ncbi:hypothetical protein BV25DRAFT_1326767 [Artomyces pyxidatus]|uniref:Uncharacterized protein n=1 Tax=Artomyces pyxidatus TaxID=48021 RepID=A0ACB8SN81_9AGAM|nr:hypothetical protein BV25DRAFT_1326767 [Artomyces pyxidatus]
MVNWHDPIVLSEDYLAVTKQAHVFAGIYMWEYATSFDFEWNILTGRRPYRWTIWVYVICRLTALLGWALQLVALDAPSPNCVALDISFYVIVYISIACASLIIILRISAIWERNRLVMIVSVSIWVASIALNIRGAAIGRSSWSPTLRSCFTLNIKASLTNSIGILVCDLVLLGIMLAGLMRTRIVGRYGLWKLLFQQSVAWMALAAVAEVPTVVFLVLNLNDAWNLMFMPTELLILVTGATRMHRVLANYGTANDDISGVTRPSAASKPGHSTLQFRQAPTGSDQCDALTTIRLESLVLDSQEMASSEETRGN